ncbi:MAG: hypothetical protein EOP31_30115 [Rhodococcus sp. (in: high G+C Gram-positive bacteria)]|nr:MAG: hypothetical protein EOP31_30115 [Rhodococcus sp. (in: high G+C Gram-positive bacteria)]
MRSSSAAKKTDADFRISLARLSSRFSARRLRISAAISLVTPGRSPASVCALRIQLSSVCAVPMLSLSATDSIAAHSDGYSYWTSATIRTARSRSSGG